MNICRTGRRTLNALRAAANLASPYRPISPLLLRHSPVLPPPCAAASIRHLSFWQEDLTHRYEIKPPINWGIGGVPEKHVFIIERFGKYLKTLEAGIHLLIPFVDQIAFVHSLKLEVIRIPHQIAFTKDDIKILIGGTFQLKIVDPKLASYAVNSPIYATIELAQTTMRRKTPKYTLAEVDAMRTTFSEKMKLYINETAKDWGVECLSYSTVIVPKGWVDWKMRESKGKTRAEILESCCLF